MPTTSVRLYLQQGCFKMYECQAERMVLTHKRQHTAEDESLLHNIVWATFHESPVGQAREGKKGEGGGKGKGGKGVYGGTQIR